MTTIYFAHGAHEETAQTIQTATDKGDGVSLAVYILVGATLIGLMIFLRRINK